MLIFAEEDGYIGGGGCPKSIWKYCLIQQTSSMGMQFKAILLGINDNPGQAIVGRWHSMNLVLVR